MPCGILISTSLIKAQSSTWLAESWQKAILTHCDGSIRKMRPGSITMRIRRRASIASWLTLLRTGMLKQADNVIVCCPKNSKNRLKPMRFWLVKSILILLLTGSCALHAEQEIKIGWIGPLSGPASFLGVDSVEVARRVFDEANRENAAPGLRFKLVVQDDQYETAKSLTSYAHLVSAEGAKVIFIITYGGNLALAQKAQKDGVLLINPLDCDEELAALPENCFCVAKRSEDLGIENARHILKHKNSPTAILYFNEDPFGPKVAAATKDTLESAGEEVVLYEGVLGSTKDFRPWIIKAKKAGVKSLMVYGYDSFGLAFKQAKEMGLEAAFYSLTNVNSPGFKETAGPAVEAEGPEAGDRAQTILASGTW
ncbi:MAG: hypothetical protein DCC75_04465 [Proteobacteria bacterium]|nr:MAG: hypothetical protein DCC75_04465 [Pseudomonadota bacterium]